MIPARASAIPVAPAATLDVDTASMGTSSAGRSQQRPGGGGSPGAWPDAKITPEPRKKRAPARSRPGEHGKSGVSGDGHPRRVVPRAGDGSSLHRSTMEEGRTVPPRRCPPTWTCRARARGARALAGRQGLRAQPGAERRQPDLDVLRGPADRERHARRAPRRGPGVQGRLPPLQDDEGLPRPPQGRLGLPRPAGRDRRGEGARLHRQAGHRAVRHRRVQRPLPRVGAAARRRVRPR